jgi:uncharacterized protein involved in cysteine biosynthesis
MARNAINEAPRCSMTKAAYWMGILSIIIAILQVAGIIVWLTVISSTATGAAAGP